MNSIVEITNLTRRFWRQVALDRVSLEIQRGEVYGLVGENGAGKTTLIRHVLGLLKAQTGRVAVFGLDPVKHPVGVLSRIGYLSESRHMPDWMRVRELMAYTQAFFPGWDAAFAEELREMFELSKEQRIRSLSRGQRARAGLLVALGHRPEFLILDEPSSGLDPIVRRDILTAVIRTVADEGRTVLFSSHLLDEVERVADRLSILHAGQVILTGQVDGILQEHRLLTIHFDQPQAQRPRLAGALGWTGEGTEWSCVCNGQLERLRDEVASAGATIVEERQPSLEDVFVARVRRDPLATKREKDA